NLHTCVNARTGSGVPQGAQHCAGEVRLIGPVGPVSGRPRPDLEAAPQDSATPPRHAHRALGARDSLGRVAASPTPPATPDTALRAAPDGGRGRIVGWAMWDWGSQPFNTVITTFVFSVYLTSESFGSTNTTSTALAISTALSGLLVALLAPVLGQNSDRSGRTVRNLRLQTWLLAALSASLFLVAPDPSYLVLGLVLLGAGSIVSEIAGVNYNAVIEQVASPKNIGRVSGFGWGLGYLGGIIVLLVLYFLFIQPETGLFGITGDGAMDIRVSMLVCGLWTLLFTIPTFLVLRDSPRERAPRVGIVDSYKL